MITNPASGPAVAKYHNYRSENTLKAATTNENDKTNKYIKSYGEQIRPHFRPFCLEATGAYGPKATALLKHIGIDQTTNRVSPEIAESRTWFLKLVSVICARARAQLIIHARSTVMMDIITANNNLPEEILFPSLNSNFQNVHYD
jgi:hypothetical protein